MCVTYNFSGWVHVLVYTVWWFSIKYMYMYMYTITCTGSQIMNSTSLVHYLIVTLHVHCACTVHVHSTCVQCILTNAVIMSYLWYSQTCLQRPPKGNTKSGPCRQVPLVLCMFQWETVFKGNQKCACCRQVVTKAGFDCACTVYMLHD